jgi:hypothetical protein
MTVFHIFESGAICLYIADTVSIAANAPPVGAPQRRPREIKFGELSEPGGADYSIGNPT